MGDLKAENLRLQRLTDILDSQPELIFTIDKEGRITFISDRASTSMKSSMPEDSDDDPTHISQLLTPESVETVLECIAQVRTDGGHMGGDFHMEGAGCVSSVKSVCYHDASGFQVAGYIRCSRLVRRAAAAIDDNASVDANGSDSGTAPGPPAKKSRTSNPPPDRAHPSSSMALTALNIAAASLTDGTSSSSGSGLASSNGGGTSNSSLSSSNQDDKRKRDSSSSSHGASQRGGQSHDSTESTEEEFVCVIRPADASFPMSGGSQMFSSLLSTASMVAHDLELRSSGRGNEDMHGATEVRRSGLQGSHDGSKPPSESSKATSSETGSDENGEEYADEHEQEPL